MVAVESVGTLQTDSIAVWSVLKRHDKEDVHVVVDFHVIGMEVNSHKSANADLRELY